MVESATQTEAGPETALTDVTLQKTDAALQRADAKIRAIHSFLDRDKFSGMDDIVRAPERIGTVRNKPVRNNAPIVRTPKGDWICNKCKFSVFAKRKKYRQCDTPCGRGKWLIWAKKNCLLVVMWY